MSYKLIPKDVRQQVYQKYNGHCAYCGCELEYKDMQVDHIESVYVSEYDGRLVNDNMENYNPSCRSCNFYKSTSSIEAFRKNIEESLARNLRNNFNYRMLIKYGLIKEDFKPVKFYFETEQESK